MKSYMDRFEVEVNFRIDYGDLEKIIEEEFGQEFSLVGDQELSNGSSWAATVKPDGNNEYDRADVANFRLTGHYQYDARSLLDDMCERGLISPGNYIVDVWW